MAVRINFYSLKIRSIKSFGKLLYSSSVKMYDNSKYIFSMNIISLFFIIFLVLLPLEYRLQLSK